MAYFISWANAEGWNPGIHDAETFFKTDPHGFYVGILDGKPVSCLSAVSYDDTFGFLGFYIVLPEYRGQGLGIEIWNAGMKHLQGRNIGLDGVLEQQKLYERDGFLPAYKSIRYQGVGIGHKAIDESIKPLEQVPLDDLLSYDDRFFPAPRHVFTKSWINQPDSIALAALNNGDLEGYGVLRKCHIGYKIGPLFADNEIVADHLFTALCGHAPEGSKVFLDTPEPNSRALDLARRYHMAPTFETIRMYLGKAPNLPIDGIFGVTSFELG
jgi:GNAT superfamily N-acetyltransferase